MWSENSLRWNFTEGCQRRTVLLWERSPSHNTLRRYLAIVHILMSLQAQGYDPGCPFGSLYFTCCLADPVKYWRESCNFLVTKICTLSVRPNEAVLDGRFICLIPQALLICILQWYLFNPARYIVRTHELIVFGWKKPLCLPFHKVQKHKETEKEIYTWEIIKTPSRTDSQQTEAGIPFTLHRRSSESRELLWPTWHILFGIPAGLISRCLGIWWFVMQPNPDWCFADIHVRQATLEL